MRLTNFGRFALVAVIVGLGSTGMAADKWRLKTGDPQLKSAGSLAFGPDGILFVGDTKSATVFAIGTGDTKGDPAKVNVNVKDLKEKVALALGGIPQGIAVNDLAVNPLSGNIYLSVTSGKAPAIVRVDAAGKLSQLSLKGVGFLKVTLPDAPEDKVAGQGRRRRNPRDESITDLAFSDGKVIVSGRAAGDSPSTVREIAFPFNDADQGMRIEIFHGAHGRLETTAVARAFVPFNINGKPHLLAGFTCTPLVKFPLGSIKPGQKVRGTTVAELGNRNRPLDMIVYKQDGREYLLMANSSRGVMKISTKDIGRSEGITERVGGGGVAGQTYDTIDSLKGVVQLDRLTDERGVIVTKTADGALNLSTIELP
jgi:hypothetical protein